MVLYYSVGFLTHSNIHCKSGDNVSDTRPSRFRLTVFVCVKADCTARWAGRVDKSCLGRVVSREYSGKHRSYSVVVKVSVKSGHSEERLAVYLVGHERAVGEGSVFVVASPKVVVFSVPQTFFKRIHAFFKELLPAVSCRPRLLSPRRASHRL